MNRYGSFYNPLNISVKMLYDLFPATRLRLQYPSQTFHGPTSVFLPRSEYPKLSENNLVAVDEHLLDNNRAQEFRRQFRAQVGRSQVPIWFGLLGVIPGAGTIGVGLSIANSALDAMFRHTESQLGYVTAEVMVELMAADGKFVRFRSLESHRRQGEFLKEGFFYYVTVGSEYRFFLIYSNKIRLIVQD